MTWVERAVDLLQLEQLGDPVAWLDIALLWFAIYNILILIRRTRAEQMVYGLLAIVLLFFATDPRGLFPLKAVHWILGQMLLYGPFALIMIFANPIRQALAHFGTLPFNRFRQSDLHSKIAEEIALAATAMASRRIGALIVIERVQGLRNFIETGIVIDGVVSYDLLTNVFSPKTPLHDGAVIISEGRVKAASCFLPLSSDPYISREYGTRHRAAIGITEETDALAIIVSEERGIVSLAIDGKLTPDLDARALRNLLTEQLAGDKRDGGTRWTFLKRKTSAETTDHAAVEETR